MLHLVQMVWISMKTTIFWLLILGPVLLMFMHQMVGLLTRGSNAHLPNLVIYTSEKIPTLCMLPSMKIMDYGNLNGPEVVNRNIVTFK